MNGSGKRDSLRGRAEGGSHEELGRSGSGLLLESKRWQLWRLRGEKTEFESHCFSWGSLSALCFSFSAFCFSFQLFFLHKKIENRLLCEEFISEKRKERAIYSWP